MEQKSSVIDVHAVVTAADLVRNFGQWRLTAMSTPVFITNHGRATHVLASLADFTQVARLSAQPVTGPAAGDDLVAVSEWMEQAVVICDKNLNVISANRIAHAICRRPLHSLSGKPIIEALPEIRDTLMEAQLRHTAVGSEPSAADIRSPFSLGAWLRMQCFPLGERNILIFRDITDEVERHRMADVKEAIIEAMGVHGGVGYVRLSLRGAVERVDKPFCDLLGLPEARIMGVDICDTVAIGDRAGFRENLEAVLAGRGSQRFDVGFLTNRGMIVRASVSIVQLKGAYAAEGAVMLITESITDAVH